METASATCKHSEITSQKRKPAKRTLTYSRKNTPDVSPPLKRKRQNKPKVFQTRMSPSGFVQIAKGLNEHQRNAVVELGFESLLNLEMKKIPGDLGKWLVDNFDPYDQSLHIRKGASMLVAPLDVHLTLGLSNDGIDIVDMTNAEIRNAKDEDYLEVMGKWLSEWELKDKTPILSQMPDFILSKTDGGESFRRNFILYVVASFFSGSSNIHCPKTFVKNVKDLGQIRSFNWCKYAHDRLILSVKQYREKTLSHFNGPILFLMLMYFDRVVHLKRPVERKFPTLCNWTQEHIKSRRETELKSGGYGKGMIDERLSIAIEEPTLKLPCPTPTKIGGLHHEKSDTLSQFQIDIEEVTVATKQLATSISNFKRVMDNNYKKYGKTQGLIKIRDATLAMFASFADSIPDPEVEVKEGEVNVQTSSHDDSFFEDPKVWDACDALVSMAGSHEHYGKEPRLK